MKNKYIFVLIMLSIILIASFGFTTVYVAQNQNQEENEFHVVTSFYPMYIAALNLVSDIEGVELTNLSEPQTGCLHDFQLTPQDMKLLSKADIFIIHGGGIEGFMEDVADSYPELKVLEASSKVELLEEENGVEHITDAHAIEDAQEGHVHEHDHEHEYNAHAWMSVSAYRIMVATMAEELALLDAVHAEDYILNAQIYDAKLKKLQEQQQELYEVTEGTNVILFHEAYAYVAEEYGLNVCYELNLDEERQVSAGEVAEVLAITEHDAVEFVFAEELYGKDMGETIGKESDVSVLYLDTLNRGEYHKDSYLEAMQNNIDILKNAFHWNRED